MRKGEKANKLEKYLNKSVPKYIHLEREKERQIENSVTGCYNFIIDYYILQNVESLSAHASVVDKGSMAEIETM